MVAAVVVFNSCPIHFGLCQCMSILIAICFCCYSYFSLFLSLSLSFLSPFLSNRCQFIFSSNLMDRASFVSRILLKALVSLDLHTPCISFIVWLHSGRKCVRFDSPPSPRLPTIYAIALCLLKMSFKQSPINKWKINDLTHTKRTIQRPNVRQRRSCVSMWATITHCHTALVLYWVECTESSNEPWRNTTKYPNESIIFE